VKLSEQLNGVLSQFRIGTSETQLQPQSVGAGR
jgi:hypothetical protein